MTDRQKLEALSRQKEEERICKEREAERLAETAEARRIQSLQPDRDTTRHLFEYCLKEFEGFKVGGTEHSLRVSRAPGDQFLGAENDDVMYVSFSVQSPDDGKPVPLIQARYRHGRYELYQAMDFADGTVPRSPVVSAPTGSIQGFLAILINALASVNAECLKVLFRSLRYR